MPRASCPGEDDGRGPILHNGEAGKLAATHAGSGTFAVIEETGEDFNFGLLINEIKRQG